MLEPAHQRRLGGEEALGEAPFQAVADGGRAHALDRDVAVEEVVVAEVDLAGRAFAQLAEHAVFADLGGQRRRVEGHGGACGGGGDGHRGRRAAGNRSSHHSTPDAASLAEQGHEFTPIAPRVQARDCNRMCPRARRGSPRRRTVESRTMMEAKQDLLAALGSAIQQVSPGASLAAAFETPKQAALGDFACTAAMQLAKPLKRNPREVAGALIEALMARRARAALGRGGRHRRPRLHQPEAQGRRQAGGRARDPRRRARTSAARRRTDGR